MMKSDINTKDYMLIAIDIEKAFDKLSIHSC
jgi:hypothetical protein